MPQYRTAGPARAFELARLSPPPKKEPRLRRATTTRTKKSDTPADVKTNDRPHRGLGKGISVGVLIGLALGSISLLAFELTRRDALEDIAESLNKTTANDATNATATVPVNETPPADELNRPVVLPATSLEPAATGPTIRGSSPSDGATDISPDMELAINFSEDMDKETLLQEVFVYQDGKDITSKIALEYLEDDFKLLLTPQVPFRAGATIEIRVTRGALSVTGEPLRQAELIRFTIAKK